MTDSYDVGLQSCKLEVPSAVIYSFCLICQASRQVGRGLWPGLLTGTTSVWTESCTATWWCRAGGQTEADQHSTPGHGWSWFNVNIRYLRWQLAESHSELPLNFPQVDPCRSGILLTSNFLPRIPAGCFSTAIRHREIQIRTLEINSNQWLWCCLMFVQ